MASLGYRRNSKRCKEKWEDINNYFRKTKDSGKKRLQQSKTTCPYFQQLENSELLDAIVNVPTDQPTFKLRAGFNA